MYSIETTDYGIKLTFSGYIKLAEMKKWFEESEQTVGSLKGNFHVFVDMRDLETLPPDSKAIMWKGQILYRYQGMTRSIVITGSAVTAIQFMDIANKSGIYKNERYIDASTESNWKQVGLSWILKGIEPNIG